MKTLLLLACIFLAQGPIMSALPEHLPEASLASYPSVLAAREELSLQRENAVLAGWTSPFEIAAELQTGINQDAADIYSISLSKGIPLDGSLLLARSEASLRITIAASELCAARLGVIADWHRHRLAEEWCNTRLELRRNLIHSFSLLKSLVTHQIDRGESDWLELHILLQEEGQLLLDQSADSLSARNHRNQQNLLLGEALEPSAIEHQVTGRVHPGLARLILEEAGILQQKALTQGNGFSDLKLGLGYERESTPLGDDQSVRLEFSMPLPQRKRFNQQHKQLELADRVLMARALAWQQERLRDTRLIEQRINDVLVLIDLQAERCRLYERQQGFQQQSWQAGMITEAAWRRTGMDLQRQLLESSRLEEERSNLALELKIMAGELPGIHDPEECQCPMREETHE